MMSYHWYCNLYMGLMYHTSYENIILIRLSIQYYIAHDDYSLDRTNHISVLLHTY